MDKAKSSVSIYWLWLSHVHLANGVKLVSIQLFVLVRFISLAFVIHVTIIVFSVESGMKGLGMISDNRLSFNWFCLFHLLRYGMDMERNRLKSWKDQVWKLNSRRTEGWSIRWVRLLSWNHYYRCELSVMWNVLKKHLSSFQSTK